MPSFRHAFWRLLAATLVAAAMSACATSAWPSPTTSHYDPAPGDFHLTSDPTLAPRALSLRYFGESGDPSGVSDNFALGALVVVDRSSLPGIHGVLVNGQPCDGRYELVEGMEVDIVLVLIGDACRVDVVRSHAAGAFQHGDRGAVIFAQVPLRASLSIRPIDTAVIGPVRVEPADESGAITVDSLPPGRYEVALIVGGQVVTTVEITLSPGEERVLDLSSWTGTPPPPTTPASNP